MDEGVRNFECSVAEGATEIEALLQRHALEAGADALRKGLLPDGVEAKDSGEDVRGRFGWLESAGAQQRRGGAAEFADGCGFAPCVGEPAGRKGVLHFEYCIDTLGGNVDSGVVIEEERGVDLVVKGYIDLAAPIAVGVDDESVRRAISGRQIAVEKFYPRLFGGVAAGGGVLEDVAGGEAR